MVRIYNVSDLTSTILLGITGPGLSSGKNFHNFRHINKIWRKPAPPRKEKPMDLQLLHTQDWENLARHKMSRLINCTRPGPVALGGSPGTNLKVKPRSQTMNPTGQRKPFPFAD